MSSPPQSIELKDIFEDDTHTDKTERKTRYNVLISLESYQNFLNFLSQLFQENMCTVGQSKSSHLISLVTDGVMRMTN